MQTIFRCFCVFILRMWRSFTCDDPTREVETQSMNEAHAPSIRPTGSRRYRTIQTMNTTPNRIESGERKNHI